MFADITSIMNLLKYKRGVCVRQIEGAYEEIKFNKRDMIFKMHERAIYITST